jgi:acetyl esterase
MTPLDPQVKVLLDQMAAANQPAFHSQTPADARKAMGSLVNVFGPGPDVQKVENRKIPGSGGEIPVRIYAPSGKPNGILVYFHGGGWVVGDLESHDYLCRALTNETGCAVVAIDYRLAPEHKFPAGPDDCYAATQWASKNAASLGSDADHIAVGGDSAGGNLAAAVALMARDRGAPRIRHQMLIYPVTDAAMNTASQREFTADGFVLSKLDMEWFWGHYLKNPKDGENPYASPIRAKDLKNLPPAHIITASHDPLRDEGEAFGELLKKAGNKVKVKRYEGVVHGFVSLQAAIDQGKTATRELAEELKASLK